MKKFFIVTGATLLMGGLTSGAVERRFKLPPDTAKLKPGAGVEQATSNCLLCHSADYISTQPRLDRAGWLSEVNKMREKFGAPIPTNRVDALVDYLTLNYGKADPKK
jgi:hypothetical protein